MTTSTHSELNQELSNNLDNGIVLDVTMQDLQFTAYVLIAETNLELVSKIVPYDEYIKYDNLHVGDLSNSKETKKQLDDISFNMDFGDGLVLFCDNQETYKQALIELGYKSSTIN